MEYGITATDFYKRGKSLLRSGATGGPELIYAALEFRIAIERLLFEYLVIIDEKRITKEIANLYRSKDLKKTVLDFEPEFERIVEFANIIFEKQAKPKAVVPNLDLLSQLYGKLGNYLHSPKKVKKTTENSEWWSSLTQILNDSEKALHGILAHPRAHVKMNRKGRDVYILWKANKITSQQVVVGSLL